MQQQPRPVVAQYAYIELLPLRYTGPAPPPAPACMDPTPDEQYRRGVAEKRAALKQKEARRQMSSSGSGMLASLKSAVSQAVMTMEKGAADVSTRTESQVRQLEYQYDCDRFNLHFHELAENGEVLLADYRCSAMHSGLRVNGHVQITPHYLCFLAETTSSIAKTTDAVMGVFAAARHPTSANDEPRNRPVGIKQVIALADIVSIQPSVVLESIGGQAPFFMLLPAPTVRPTALQLYTQDSKLYQFMNFESLVSRATVALNDVVKGTALDQAYNYLDHAWRDTVNLRSKDV
ncbi:GRAM_domain_containing_protein_-_putative [Leishmania major strain Friedlin]|nr:GRAM_domain_containing_protein_-_putative [Leishmania major strain Friedlin]